MSVETLDFLFPFFLLIYGFVATLLFHSNWICELAARVGLADRTIIPWQVHRKMALAALILGGLWSLQVLSTN